ncbi:MAG: ATP-binding protein [Deltaproteobacteria bacterium]|nr:ATP-binding protein [Deltaproteobacteria bacterium]
MSERQLPAWAEQIRSTYLRGESSVFLLHGNVFDLILHGGELMSVVDFLAQVLLSKKDVICHFNPSNGVKFRKKEAKVANLDELLTEDDTAKVLAGMEKMLRTTDGVALILDYAETIAPAGETSFLSESDRKAQVTLHRWSLDRTFENADNVVVLIAEQLPQLSPKLVSNPRIAAIEVPLPTEEERAELVRRVDPEATERERARLAALSAGLKNVQLRGILLPGEDSEEDQGRREMLILQALEPKGDVRMARKLARMTSGMTDDEALEYLRDVKGIDVRFGDPDRYAEVLGLLDKRKREILERECFGMVEFVDPDHDFSAVGGMEEVKRELMQIAHNIREGNRSRVPMGLLFTGPMGTGKTFVAEAFAKSSGLTAIKLKNFRSKWVGATEGNLEKILSVVKAIGNVLVIIDEGDRAFGNTSGDDGGTSSRVIARIKEFMSDTTNRGRVLFVLMTNRPDKLDIDIKRAGRLDRKVPFFYGQEPEDVEPILVAQLRRHKVTHDIEFPRDRGQTSARLVGYSNADIEAVVLATHDAAAATGEQVTAERMGAAIDDYLPSRDAGMLEYMELLAVFESSSRKLLPKRYKEISMEELQLRLRNLKAQVS